MEQTKQELTSPDRNKPFMHDPHLVGRIPKWTVTIGILLIGVIYYFLAPELKFGPDWLLLALEVVILLPLWIFWAMGRAIPYPIARRLSLLLLMIVTLVLGIAVISLVVTLHNFKSGLRLLSTGALLWTLNVLVFALWYWDTDGGGPRKRHEANHKAVDLMFPQQQMSSGVWAPDFVDYLFVAFTGATAFSPTDTYPLTHRAKILMMVEGIISLTIVAIIVSRVANIF